MLDCSFSCVLLATAIFSFGIILGYGGMWRLSALWTVVKHTASSEEMKMVLVVRKDLKMGAGKVAAQCAHAAVASVEMVAALASASDADFSPNNRSSTTPSFSASGSRDPNLLWPQWLSAWRSTGYAKVVLQCQDEAEMMGIAQSAKSAGLPYYVIRDAGRTQIAAGSKTVVSIGPAPKSMVDQVTGHLKLL